MGMSYNGDQRRHVGPPHLCQDSGGEAHISMLPSNVKLYDVTFLCALMNFL